MSIVELSNVNKIYKTGKIEVHALRDIDLEIESGEFLSFAGPSGSGKTTLLNLIGCLDKPTTGDIHINGTPTATFSKNQLADLRRKNIGFVFQSFNIIPVLTAFENVEFPLILTGKLNSAQRTELVDAILEEVGLAEMKGRRPNELSGGQQQRVAVARALVKEPILVLADEPTANLDSQTGENILRLMLELNEKRGTTFVFSTHDKMVMEYAKRLILLKDGAIAEDQRKTAD